MGSLVGGEAFFGGVLGGFCKYFVSVFLSYLWPVHSSLRASSRSEIVGNTDKTLS